MAITSRLPPLLFVDDLLRELDERILGAEFAPGPVSEEAGADAAGPDPGERLLIARRDDRVRTAVVRLDPGASP